MATKKTASKKASTAKSKKADKAFEGPLGQALGVVRTPVYAYIGANDLAIEAATGIVSDLRRRASETAAELQEKAANFQGRAAEVPDRVQAVPADVQALLDKYNPEELRKVAEAYVQVAAGIYSGLATRGEDVVTRLRKENPQLDAGLNRAGEAVSSADERINEGIEAGEETLGTVSRQTRSLGVRGANKVSKAAHEAADEVSDAAFEASDNIQSVAAKAESKTSTAAKKAPAKKAPAKKAPAKKAPAKKAASTATKSTATKSTASKSTTAAKKAPAKKSAAPKTNN
ncbi:hypothetical protein [Dietzia timorensis]|uniref:Heparin-binding hemagglutinin n=1 Tax=Dietzia timorensis TaxID=499555 RepID=A0A173LMI6_9ACTN|nr:hypothetical protein [Dietzia timorensis]ANI93486.1 Heparin-binding hemagglutinin [Dietzia timorensis]